MKKVQYSLWEWKQRKELEEWAVAGFVIFRRCWARPLFFDSFTSTIIFLCNNYLTVVAYAHYFYY